MSTAAPLPTPGLPQRMQSDRLKFPGMTPAEILVLKAWLKINEAQFDRFDYNVRIGPDYVSPTPLTPDVQRNANLLHKLRLDAVGWRGVDNALLPKLIESPSEIYKLFPQALAVIIDAKRRATTGHVGQLINYRDVWVSENPQNAPPDLVLACATYQPALVPSALAHNIQVNTVSVDFTILRPQK